MELPPLQRLGRDRGRPPQWAHSLLPNPPWLLWRSGQGRGSAMSQHSPPPPHGLASKALQGAQPDASYSSTSSKESPCGMGGGEENSSPLHNSPKGPWANWAVNLLALVAGCGLFF